jgi:hypothetical protein
MCMAYLIIRLRNVLFANNRVLWNVYIRNVMIPWTHAAGAQKLGLYR